MAAPLPTAPPTDLLPRRILGLCAALALLVPFVLVVGVLLRFDPVAGSTGEALRGLLIGSAASLAWAVPAGLLLAPVLFRAERPVLRTVLRVLWDLPTVCVAGLLWRHAEPGPLAAVALGLVVVPQVALGAAQALERTPRGTFQAARAMGMSRSRFAWRIGWPRVRGSISAVILRAWGRGVGELLITQAVLGWTALSAQAASQEGPAALLLLAVAFTVPWLASRLEQP